jgi:DNA sulfur modification protein DndD
MLRLKRLEVEGFGPFAYMQVVEFPPGDGVTVVYGENMRGKTSLLNAIRYAFFGTVLSRGERERRLHTISNRERAAGGEYGFSVALSFEFEHEDYELYRECRPKPGVREPTSDDDYDLTVGLRRGASPLNPDERQRALLQIFPREISRFFLFDGELLQQYEELLINESAAGLAISEAIERILGVPILTRGKIHLSKLSSDADKQAAKDASKHDETRALANALEQAMASKEAHEAEIERQRALLDELTAKKNEVEQYLQSKEKYAALLSQKDEASDRLRAAKAEEIACRASLQAAMGEAWRSLVRETVRSSRTAAQQEAAEDLDAFAASLRVRAVEDAHCGTCDQNIAEPALSRLRDTVARTASGAALGRGGVSAAMGRLADLNKFHERDNASEVRHLATRLRTLELEQATLTERVGDLNTRLKESDPETLRRSKASYAEVVERIMVTKRAIEQESAQANAKDENVQRLKKLIKTAGSPDLQVGQERARILRDASEVFAAAIDRYKLDLKKNVESTASQLFRSMTTETEDYAGLTIGQSYGLTIQHRDGRAEHARSAGAEHIVALALMGALQQNAPLRGPIVMDSPFGRLDDKHTANVVATLPMMAKQVVLLVYEGEVGREQMRELLKNSLRREYQLDRVSARRTEIRMIK